MPGKSGPRRARVVPTRLKALNMRTTDELRAHLEEAAAKSGRSLTGEVEHRLEMSFAEDRMRAIAREEALKVQAERAAGANLEFRQWVIDRAQPSGVPESQRVKIYNGS